MKKESKFAVVLNRSGVKGSENVRYVSCRGNLVAKRFAKMFSSYRLAYLFRTQIGDGFSVAIATAFEVRRID